MLHSAIIGDKNINVKPYFKEFEQDDQSQVNDERNGNMNENQANAEEGEDLPVF